MVMLVVCKFAVVIEEPTEVGVVNGCVESVIVVEDVSENAAVDVDVDMTELESVFQKTIDPLNILAPSKGKESRPAKSGDGGDVDDCLRRGGKHDLDDAVDDVLLCVAAVGVFVFEVDVGVSTLIFVVVAVLPLEVGLALLGTMELLLPVEGGVGNSLPAIVSLEFEAVVTLDPMRLRTPKATIRALKEPALKFACLRGRGRRGDPRRETRVVGCLYSHYHPSRRAVRLNPGGKFSFLKVRGRSGHCRLSSLRMGICQLWFLEAVNGLYEWMLDAYDAGSRDDHHLRIQTVPYKSNPLPSSPPLTIQPTFLTVLNKVYNGIIPSEKFWVSCYAPTPPSEHVKVLAELDEVNRGRVNFSSIEGSSSVKRDGTGYEVSCASLNRSEGGITGLDFVFPDSGDEGGLGISTADGLPYIATLAPSAGVKGELVGTGCDPVRHVVRRVVSGREEVWCTGDDGVVRRYLV
ncbi:hypothetical protein BDQ17DRAFT_1337883 [Cyathus striatus]|nr:hypothetical protein BDQ17DRAFT_1337883 [Cyathus striatus]